MASLLAQLGAMSVPGQKAISRGDRITSALPPTADIGSRARQVRFVPTADLLTNGAVLQAAGTKDSG